MFIEGIDYLTIMSHAHSNMYLFIIHVKLIDIWAKFANDTITISHTKKNVEHTRKYLHVSIGVVVTYYGYYHEIRARWRS